jgi:hypothetical protein
MKEEKKALSSKLDFHKHSEMLVGWKGEGKEGRRRRGREEGRRGAER